MTSRGRLLLACLLAPPLVLIGLLSVAVPFRLPLADWVLRTQAPALGLPRIDGRVTALDLDHLILEDLRVSDDQAQVTRVTVTYDWRDLLSGHLRTVLIEDATLRGSLNGADLRFPLLDSLLENGDTASSGGSAPPLDRLEARNTRLVLDSDKGPMTVTNDLTLTPTDEDPRAGWSVSWSGEATGPGLKAHGTAEARVALDGTVKTASGALSGGLTAFSLPDLVEGLDLTADLTGTYDGANLQAEGTTLSVTLDKLAPAVLKALPTVARGPLSAPLSLTLGNGDQPMTLELSLTDSQAPAHLSGPVSLTLGDSEDKTQRHVSLQARTDITLPGVLSVPDLVRMRGTVDASAQVVALPLASLTDRLDGTVDLHLALDGDGAATLELKDGTTVQVDGLAPSLVHPLDALGPHDHPRLSLVEGPLRLKRAPTGAIEAAGTVLFQPRAGMPGWITLTLENVTLPEGDPLAGGTIRAGHLNFSELTPPGSTDLSGTLTFDDAQWSANAASTELQFDLTGASYATEDLAFSDLRQTGRATLRWEAANNRLTADPLSTQLTLAALDQGPRAFKDVTLDWRGPQSLELDSGLIRGQPDRLTLGVASGALEDGVILTAPLALALAAPTNLTARTDTGQLSLAETRFAPTTLSLDVNGEPLTAKDLSLAVSGPWPPGPGAPLALTLEDGAITGFGLATRAVTGTFALEQGGPRGGLKALVDRLPGEKRPAKGARPLSLELSLSHPEPGTDSDHFPLAARLTDPKGRLSLGLEGWTTDSLSEGQVRMAARPVEFAPDGLQPDALHAALQGIAHSVTGTLALKGTLAWKGKRLSPNLSILAKDVSATLGDVPMENLNGVIHLTRFWPPRGPTQEVSVGTVRLGLPMNNALIRYALDGRGNLVIENASLDLAGGHLTTGDVTVPLEGGQTLVPLDVTGVSLAELAGLTKLDGLAASGSLGGRIPLRVEGDGAIWVDKATLETESPGLLSYRPPESPEVLAAGNEGVLLLLLALDNFQYERLKLTLDGESSGELAIGISLLGANPDLYDGYPVDLNVNLTGALTELIRENLRTYTLPGRIEKNLEQFMNSLGYTGATAPTVP